MGTTKFIVRNTTREGKKIRIFNYPIWPGYTRDLMQISYITEETIRDSLLKGELLRRLLNGDIQIVESNIDLLQFDDTQKAWLESVGITSGTEIDAPDLARKAYDATVPSTTVANIVGYSQVLYSVALDNLVPNIGDSRKIAIDLSIYDSVSLKKDDVSIIGSIYKTGANTYSIVNSDDSLESATSVGWDL